MTETLCQTVVSLVVLFFSNILPNAIVYNVYRFLKKFDPVFSILVFRSFVSNLSQTEVISENTKSLKLGR